VTSTVSDRPATSGQNSNPDPNQGSGKNAGKPKRSLSPRKVGAMLIAPPAILSLSLIANGARQSRERGNATQVAERALKAAFEKVPFKVRLPKPIPENAKMVRVFLDEPDSDRGFQAFQLNVWYTTPGLKSEGGGQTIHIWQSNDKFLSRRLRDPLQMVGEPETLKGETWHRVLDDRVETQIVTTFSKRYDDGITMTVDAKDPNLARSTIEALVTAQPSIG
jgi:hypothetical protein